MQEVPHLQTLTMRLCSGMRGSTLSQTARVPVKLVASVVAACSGPNVFPLKAMPKPAAILQSCMLAVSLLGQRHG